MSELWAVTGASGFIGRHLAGALRARGACVRGLTRTGGEDAIAGTLEEVEALGALVSGADVIVHLAGYVHKRARTAEERRECRATNVDGTKRLVDAIVEGSPQALLIYVSTANVYSPSEETLDENAAVIPKSYYGETKLEAERVVLDAVRASRIRAVVLRPAMVFGRGAPGNLVQLIKLLRCRVAPLVGGGANLKSLVPVEVLVAAIEGLAAAGVASSGEIFNVAGATLSMRRIVELLAEGMNVSFVRLPIPIAPIRTLARTADFITAAMRIPAPEVAQVVDTFARSARLTDAKLRALVPLPGQASVEAALRRIAAGS